MIWEGLNKKYHKKQREDNSIIPKSYIQSHVRKKTFESIPFYREQEYENNHTEVDILMKKSLTHP